MLLEDLQVVLSVAEFRSVAAASAHLDMHTANASVGERYLPQCGQECKKKERPRRRSLLVNTG